MSDVATKTRKPRITKEEKLAAIPEVYRALAGHPFGKVILFGNISDVKALLVDKAALPADFVEAANWRISANKGGGGSRGRKSQSTLPFTNDIFEKISVIGAMKAGDVVKLTTGEKVTLVSVGIVIRIDDGGEKNRSVSLGGLDI